MFCSNIASKKWCNKRKTDKQIFFKGPYLPQNWSLPDSIIYNLTKNPSNAKVWQKLIQTCKYFFAKNPLSVIDRLNFNFNTTKCSGFYNYSTIKIDETNVKTKFWITDELFTPRGIASNSVSMIISKIYQVNNLFLVRQKISWNEFLLISSNVKKCFLEEIILRNEDETIVSLEKLIEGLPKIENFEFYDNRNASSITKDTAKKLFQISHFSKIDKFRFRNIPETFDIEIFFSYLKKNMHTEFFLSFCNSVSNDYKIRVNTIIKEIRETINPDYKRFVIYIQWI